jgi:hypothetical protein
MPSRFDDRFQAQGVPVHAREHGFDVTLRRANLLSPTIRARRVGGRSYEAMGQPIGIVVKTERQALMLPIASVMLNGQTVEPQTGDEILIGDEVWKLHAPDDTTPPTEAATNGYDWLVHVQRIEE